MGIGEVEVFVEWFNCIQCNKATPSGCAGCFWRIVGKFLKREPDGRSQFPVAGLLSLWHLTHGTSLMEEVSWPVWQGTSVLGPEWEANPLCIHPHFLIYRSFVFARPLRRHELDVCGMNEGATSPWTDRCPPKSSFTLSLLGTCLAFQYFLI